MTACWNWHAVSSASLNLNMQHQSESNIYLREMTETIYKFVNTICRCENRIISKLRDSGRCAKSSTADWVTSFISVACYWLLTLSRKCETKVRYWLNVLVSRKCSTLYIVHREKYHCHTFSYYERIVKKPDIISYYQHNYPYSLF